MDSGHEFFLLALRTLLTWNLQNDQTKGFWTKTTKVCRVHVPCPRFLQLEVNEYDLILLLRCPAPFAAITLHTDDSQRVV